MSDDNTSTLAYRVSSLEADVRNLKSEGLVTAVTVLQIEHKALERNVQSLANDTLKPLAATVSAIQAKQEQSIGLKGGLKVIIGVGLMAIFAGGSFFLALVQTFGAH